MDGTCRRVDDRVAGASNAEGERVRLVDLTRVLDPRDKDRLPAGYEAAAPVLFPDVEYVAPDSRGRDEMCAVFGCGVDDLPDGEGWGNEHISRSGSHMGTHLDAPLHYGSTCEGDPARTITDIALGELFLPGAVLDVRGAATPGEAIPTAALIDAVVALDWELPKASALLLRTGQEDHDLDDPRFFHYPGMSRDGTLLLAKMGGKVLGTDALGWDRPFLVMAEAFHRTGDRAELWDGHFAGREREVFIVQQLANLAELPPTGFTIGCFPIPLARASAAPARVVAFLPEEP
jgi:kynurenine formamidase